VLRDLSFGAHSSCFGFRIPVFTGTSLPLRKQRCFGFPAKGRRLALFFQIALFLPRRVAASSAVPAFASTSLGMASGKLRASGRRPVYWLCFPQKVVKFIVHFAFFCLILLFLRHYLAYFRVFLLICKGYLWHKFAGCNELRTTCFCLFPFNFCLLTHKHSAYELVRYYTK